MINLFRINLTKTSLTVYNEKGDFVAFDLVPGTAEWRQLAVSVVKNSIAMYSTCGDAPWKTLPRNLTLWREGGVVVGDEDHESEDHLEVCTLILLFLRLCQGFMGLAAVGDPVEMQLNLK